MRQLIQQRRLAFMKDRLRASHKEVAFSPQEAAHFNQQRHRDSTLEKHMAVMELQSRSYTASVGKLADSVRMLLKGQLTLRDQFALGALQGLLADTNPLVIGDEGPAETYAKEAYSYADAMLAERAAK